MINNTSTIEVRPYRALHHITGATSTSATHASNESYYHDSNHTNATSNKRFRYCAGVGHLTWIDDSPMATTSTLSIKDYGVDEVEAYMKRLFAMGDVNGDGVLDLGEFRHLLQLSGFKFSPTEIDMMVNAADANGDGVIDYNEFVPTMRYMLLDEVARHSPPLKSARGTAPTLCLPVCLSAQ